MIWYNAKQVVSKKLKDVFINYTNSYFNMDIPAEHPQGSATYLGLAIVNLALAYLVTKEKRYLERAIAVMDGVCNYKTWGFAHLVNVDLSASFILFGLTLGYTYLEEELTAEQKKRYYKNIQDHALIMYEYKRNNLGNGWPTNYWQNHNWINHTALLMAGHLLNDETIINDALANFKIVFANLPADGSNYEGVTYWRYGGMWLFVSAWLIKELGYYDYFSNCSYLENTFYYRLYQTDASLKKQLNFGDCHDRYSSHSIFVYYLIAKIYHNPYAKYLGDKVLANIYEEQLMSHVKPGVLPELGLAYLAYANIKGKNIKNLPLFKYFPDLGLISIRSSWQPDSLVFSMKSSYPGGKLQWEKGNLKTMSLSHHHPDNLSYILTKGEDYFAIDDGYNRNIIEKNHNSLLVDGRLCDVMNKNDIYLESIRKRLMLNPNYQLDLYHGTIKNLLFVNDYLVYKADSTNTYPLDLALDQVSRLVVVKPKCEYIVFIDVFKAKEKHTYETIINSDYEAQVKDTNLDVYQGLSTKVYHYVYSLSGLVNSSYQNVVKSIMTTQEPNNYVVTKQLGRSFKAVGTNVVIMEVLSCHNLAIRKNKNYFLLGNKDKLYLEPPIAISDAKAFIVSAGKLIILEGSYVKIANTVIYQADRIGNYIVEVNDEIFE